MSRLKEVSATGNVDGTEAVLLRSVVLTAGSDAASLVVRDGGSGGTTILTLKAAASTSVTWRAADDHGVQVTETHATFTGTSPVATFEYER